jgi:hypothetical protein
VYALGIGKLTRLWTRASASLPVRWHLAGVMTRDVASKWSAAIEPSGEDEWVALALEMNGSGLAVAQEPIPSKL